MWAAAPDPTRPPTRRPQEPRGTVTAGRDMRPGALLALLTVLTVVGLGAGCAPAGSRVLVTGWLQDRF